MIWALFGVLLACLGVFAFLLYLEREELRDLRRDHKTMREHMTVLIAQLAHARGAALSPQEREPFRSEVVDENGLHFEGGDPRTPRTPEELGSAILEERLRVEERIHDLDERIGVGDG